MGLNWSKRRDDWHNPHRYQYPHPPPPPPLPPPPSSHSPSASPHPPPPPASASSSAPFSAFSLPPPAPVHLPPPPSPPAYVFPASSTYSSAPSFPGNQGPPPYTAAVPYPAQSPPAGHAYRYPPGGYGNPARVFRGRSNYQYYAPRQEGGWWPPLPHPASSASSLMAPQQPPPPYVEHQKAVTIKNNVNLHKDTIRLVWDEHNPDHYLVSFTFDSLVDGRLQKKLSTSKSGNLTSGGGIILLNAILSSIPQYHVYLLHYSEGYQED